MIVKRQFVSPNGKICEADVDINASVPTTISQEILIDHKVAGIISAVTWMEVQKVSPFGKILTLLLYPFITFEEYVILRVVSNTSNVVNECIILPEVVPLMVAAFSGAVEDADKHIRSVLSIQ